MSRPLLLDLFCCEGGAAKGYQRAGFHVVGVDLLPQPRYCGDEFVQGDALTVGADLLASGRFHAVHASPPCQSYSKNFKHLAAPQPMLIEPVRDLLVASGLPWVIENVEGAPLGQQDDLFGSYGTQLCGTSFGLRVYRHRLFETSFPVTAVPCQHRGHAMNPHNVAGREHMYAEFGRGVPEKRWAEEMGVGWMSRHGARESIPPVFTEYLGGLLLLLVEVAA